MLQLHGRLQAKDLFSGKTWTWSWKQGHFQGGVLTEDPQQNGKSREEPRKSKGLLAGPALCDPQINGGLGYSFGHPGEDPAPFLQLIEHLKHLGIAWFFPTLITDHVPRLVQAFERLEEFRRQFPVIDQACPGYHLEGPWISPVDGFRGAHPLECVCEPEIDAFNRLQKAAGGRIRLVTLAPELPGALSMIRLLCAKGVKIAIGHTQADRSTIQAAVDAGVTLSTHLGNGMAASINRHANPLWPQLAQDALVASFIPDGHHLPTDFIRCLVRSKGKDRLIITADSSPVAGLPPGQYSLWNALVEIQENGRVGMPGTPFLAGSGCFTDHCIRFLTKTGEVSLEEALNMASTQTAKHFSLPNPWDPEGGTFVLFEQNPENPWKPHLVCVGGQGVWASKVALESLDQSD